MSMDITAFYQTFFDEADELLADMEQHLLLLDPLTPDNEQLNAISVLHIRSRAVPLLLVLRYCKRQLIYWKTCWMVLAATRCA
ncbi:hypothetical protein [Yersinia pestis]|uniref:hypothetical protein n=1 Tax=Yersinia pestis TaxID=632 RepID=UPI003C740A51